MLANKFLLINCPLSMDNQPDKRGHRSSSLVDRMFDVGSMIAHIALDDERQQSSWIPIVVLVPYPCALQFDPLIVNSGAIRCEAITYRKPSLVDGQYNFIG